LKTDTRQRKDPEARERSLVQRLVLVPVALALVALVYGACVYNRNADEAKLQQGQQHDLAEAQARR
jgi:hypothetical protein